MSTFSNTPQLPQPAPASAPLSSGVQGTAVGTTGSATSLNAGAISTVLAVTNSQLTLATSHGKINLPASKLTPVLDVGKDVAINLSTDKSNTILEVAAKYNQQRLTLTPQQSQQVLQIVTQTPTSLSNSLEVKGRVLSIQQNQIQVSVNGQTVNLSVRNPQQYQPGQDVKLGLSSGTLGWEVSVQNSKVKESFRLPAEETGKILASLRPGQPIELSDKGKQLVRPILRDSSTSQLPASLNKVTLNNTEGRLSAQLEIGSHSIAKLNISNSSLRTLSNVELQSTSGAASFRENGLHSDIRKLLGSSSESKPTTINQLTATQKTTPEVTHVYRNPVANTAKNHEVSPDIDKTIKASQEQFADINVKQKPQAAPVINEIKLSDVKDGRQAPATAENPKTTTKASEIPLSNSAQQILNTLKSLTSENPADVRQTMLQNLNKVIDASGTTGNGIKAADFLKLVKQVSEQTGASGGTQFNSLIKAVDELLNNSGIEENVKGHIRQAINQVRPEQSGLPVPDMQSIKQLLQSAALPLTPVSIVTPTPSAGLVAGLVNLLQVSLAARLNRSNQQIQDKLNTSLAGIAASGVKTTSAGKPAGQNMRELSNLEQKHNLVKVLSDLVNQHSQQKIQNAERTLQGQEAMYYVLPFGTSDEQKPVELLVQRDKQERENSGEDTPEIKSWLLTMKLPVGELGEILTKSKVTEETISVDLYTSSEELKKLTMNYLPLLKRRFNELGLNLEIGRCERGNIPEQLAKNPYQILETRV